MVEQWSRVGFGRWSKKGVEQVTKLTAAEIEDIADHAEAIVDRLPATRKVEQFAWFGKTYRAVRVFGGFQVQSGNRRHLIIERRK